MDPSNIIECGGFYFIHNFDSGNLGHVERVPTELIAPYINPRTNSPEVPDYEFNLWTRPDCAGTEFENGNRTWFYFGVQPSVAGAQVRLNLINLNKQGKMYNQGMAPVTRTLPGKPQWERIRDRPVHSTDDNTFTLSFKYRTAENLKATTFFAFTYPFSFAELQIALNSIDAKLLPLASPQSFDDIYYCRECLIYSLEGRRVDLLTITSYHGITQEREERLKNLFPDKQERAYKFQNKKVIFISARVHPGETPSSFVFNGFLNLLLSRNDPIAIQLRKNYVFKMIPFLNPDGVARGHYRTDTRGVNLNRVYLCPSLSFHPTVYASRALIRYYHFGCEKEDTGEELKSIMSRSIQNINESSEYIVDKKKRSLTTPPKSDSKKEKMKPLITNKSTATGTDLTKKDGKVLTSDAANLADQVCDMKLQELPKLAKGNAEDQSLLNHNTLRSCLGSDVHLSTSEELNVHGHNPLRPLRDALKNSISLLMESNSSTGDASSCRSPPSVRMGWCAACSRAVSRLEPSATSGLPRAETSQDTDTVDKHKTVYFCTNCFKRYMLTENNEEVKLNDISMPGEVSGLSTLSGGLSGGLSGLSEVSGGDHSELQEEANAAPRANAVGDSNAPEPSPPKEERPQKLSAKKVPKKSPSAPPTPAAAPRVYNCGKEPDSGLFLYIDLHGHASKKGIFMYGNHFEDLESSVECMLLPRIMSLNNLHFHFSSCNFTERNMYLKDRRDGMSREGSGRVAVLKATGLVRSYTLECNYNTGRLVNVLPPDTRDPAPPRAAAPTPPKYTPHIFEEVGRSLGASILDLTGQHPNSRIPCSEHRSLASVRDWLRAHSRTLRPQLTSSRLRPKVSSPSRAPLFARSKAKATDERKENAYTRPDPPAARYAKLEPPRYLADNEPKPKSLAKRRHVLALRKPPARPPRARRPDEPPRCRALASSSSDSAPPAAPPAAPRGKRRPFAGAAPAHLKKIRLKAAL